MASGWTNKGAYALLGYVYRGDTLPTNYYVRLHTSASTPDADTNTASDLTQITAGNGYSTGGYSLSPGSTDFDTHVEDDTNDWAYVEVKDVVWTASGGSIPDSGDGARWACLTDDNATEASRLILHYFDLVSDRSVSDGYSLTLQDIRIRIDN